MNMSRKSRAAEIELRRKKVAANLIGGMNYRDIAEALDVSVGTVANDVKILFARWQKEQVRDYDELITAEVRRCDRLLNAVWNEAMDGKLTSIDRALKIMERRARLLGLDAPMRQDVTSGGETLKVVLGWGDDHADA